MNATTPPKRSQELGLFSSAVAFERLVFPFSSLLTGLPFPRCTGFILVPLARTTSTRQARQIRAELKIARNSRQRTTTENEKLQNKEEKERTTERTNNDYEQQRSSHPAPRSPTPRVTLLSDLSTICQGSSSSSSAAQPYRVFFQLRQAFFHAHRPNPDDDPPPFGTSLERPPFFFLACASPFAFAGAGSLFYLTCLGLLPFAYLFRLTMAFFSLFVLRSLGRLTPGSASSLPSVNGPYHCSYCSITTPSRSLPAPSCHPCRPLPVSSSLYSACSPPPPTPPRPVQEFAFPQLLAARVKH